MIREIDYEKLYEMINVLITALTVIFACFANTFFIRSKLLSSLKTPIDNKKVLKDGKRLFGDNKTWKGVVGLLFFSVFFVVLLGLICDFAPAVRSHIIFYTKYKNTVPFNILIGVLLALAYCIFELPNSFIKRRIGIEPGEKANKLVGVLFTIIDQVDSLFGCILVFSFLHPMSVSEYFIYVFCGGFIHIGLSFIFKAFKLRKGY